jgi:hypothetical protein
MDAKEFGKEIRAVRKKMRIKQNTLARMCNFRGSHIIHRIEQGESRVLVNIIKMLDTMGYTIEFKRKRM